MTGTTAMKVTIEQTVDRDTKVTATFEFFIDEPEDARNHGRQAAEAHTAFLEGYAGSAE